MPKNKDLSNSNYLNCVHIYLSFVGQTNFVLVFALFVNGLVRIRHSKRDKIQVDSLSKVSENRNKLIYKESSRLRIDGRIVDLDLDRCAFWWFVAL